MPNDNHMDRRDFLKSTPIVLGAVGALAQEIAQGLGVPMGRAALRRFSDTEVSFQIDENIRGTDVFIVQPTCTPVDQHLVELCVMIDAFRRSSAARITELEDEVSDLRSRLGSSGAVERRLADLEVEAGRVAGLEAQLDALRAERDALATGGGVAPGSPTVEALERDLEIARAESTAEITALRSRIAELQADTDRVADLEAELSATRAHYEASMRAAVQGRDGDSAPDTAPFGEVDADVDQALAMLQGDLAAAQTRISELEAQLSHAEQQRADGTDTTPVAELEGQVRHAEDARESAERQLEAAQAAAADTAGRVETLEARAELAEAELRDARQVADDLRAQVSDLGAEVDQLTMGAGA